MCALLKAHKNVPLGNLNASRPQISTMTFKQTHILFLHPLVMVHSTLGNILF